MKNMSQLVFVMALLCAPLAHAETTVQKTANSVRVTTEQGDWAASSAALLAKLSNGLKSFHAVQSVETFAITDASETSDTNGVRSQRNRLVVVRFRKDTRLPALMFKLAESETSCSAASLNCEPAATTVVTGPVESFDRVSQINNPIAGMAEAQLLTISASGSSDAVLATSNFAVRKDTFEGNLARFLRTYQKTQTAPTQVQTIDLVAGLLQHMHKKKVTP